MKPKLILIARVSDEEQRKALPAQEKKLKEYADKLKLEYEYYEFDESAHDDERRKFAELVNYIKGLPPVVFVAFDKVDRYSRDASQDEVKIFKRLVEQGSIELHFPSDNLFITSNSPANDWFRLNIGLTLANYYSNAISDNVKRRFHQMINDGYWPGWAPIGYKNITIDEDHKNIVPDPESAPHIIKAFEMRAAGMAYQQIAAQLKEAGLVGKGKYRKPISKTTLEGVLNNPFYYGKMLFKGKLYSHRYEPLISLELFNRCLAVKEERSHGSTKTRDNTYALSRLIKCGRCGRAISPYTRKNHVYLRCAGSGTQSCGNPNTAEAIVMPNIQSAISNIQIDSDWLPLVIGKLKEKHENQQLYYTQNIEQLRTEYDAIAGKLKTLYLDRLDGRITPQMHDEIANQLEARQQLLNERLKQLTNDNKSFMITTSYLLDLAQRARGLFDSSKPELKQKLLAFILSNPKLDNKKLHFNLVEPFNAAAFGPKNQNWLRGRDSNPRPIDYIYPNLSKGNGLSHHPHKVEQGASHRIRDSTSVRNSL